MQGGSRSDAIAGTITGVSVSHRNADLGTIERVSATDPDEELQALCAADGVEEAFVLHTCNRVERYVVTLDPARGRAVLGAYVDELPERACTWLSHDRALEHLLRVGAGLESMAVGEDQILGQLREAIHAASAADAVGPLLEEVVWKAIHLGTRVRTETDINEGVSSLSRAAVALAADHRPLDEESALVVGAGEMASRAALAAADAGVDELYIANRTPERAMDLAEAVETSARGLGLEDLGAALERAGLVIAATASPQYVIQPSHVRAGDETVIVDIANPRNVDPRVGERPHVRLFDLDDLEAVTTATSRARQSAIAEAETMVADALEELHAQLKRRQADDVIATMYERAEAVKRRELAEARARLADGGELDAHEREVIESLADALVNQLMAAPTQSLRDAAETDDWETIQTAIQLFDPAFPSGAAEMEDARAPDDAPIEQE